MIQVVLVIWALTIVAIVFVLKRLGEAGIFRDAPAPPPKRNNNNDNEAE